MRKEKRVVALGCFDGVHMGHRALLRAAAELASEIGAVPCVFTFPSSDSPKPVPQIFDDGEKERRLRRCGIEEIVSLPFSTVRSMEPRDFLREIMTARCHAAALVCGEDFKYGRGAAGNADTLTEYMKNTGGRAICLPHVEYKGDKVSSGRIRALLTEGDIEEANIMLTAPYTLRGTVKRGKQLGSKMGIPTANLTLSPILLVPRAGVYASEVSFGSQSYTAVTNIGLRPTMEHATVPNCETFICGYSGELYDKEITVTLRCFIRDEERFDSQRQLYTQIDRDIAQAQTYFRKADRK